MDAIVFIILQIFFATRAVLKIGEYPRIFSSFSWGIFARVTRLDQSRASENVGWIINSVLCKFWVCSNTCQLRWFMQTCAMELKG